MISSVRKDPFAVILLDEFEKAAQPVLDLFLQVFDDGRLTDLQGRVVDFRRSVIVLTSNIGSPLAQGARVGFDPADRTFSSAGIERAVRASFRPELVNRLDRIVVFRPFERSAMRALLDKELADALARRGLRGRPWAVEMDESAYTFLIEKGFSPELGARPLKRAVEQHLLAPLAAAIVEQSVPDGDQFLFVTAPAASESRSCSSTRTQSRRSPTRRSLCELDLPPSSLSLAGGRCFGSLRARGARTYCCRSRAAQDERATRSRRSPSPASGNARIASCSSPRPSTSTGCRPRLGLPSDWARASPQRQADGRANAELVGLLAGRLYVLDRALAGIENGAPTESSSTSASATPAGPSRDGMSSPRSWPRCTWLGRSLRDARASCSTRRRASTCWRSPGSVAARSSERVGPARPRARRRGPRR